MSFKIFISILCPLIFSPAFGQGSASANVHIFQIEAPQLDTLRTVRAYLPEGYSDSKEQYPVIYMHDAQNLFDINTAFSGEWKVDEFLDNQKEQKVIVIGIDHGNEHRIKELTPFANEKYGGGEADTYLDFIIRTLKPHIDSTFRTAPEAENTIIVGSSLGGLVSFYAAIKYPEVFGKAGVFSPSFWYSDNIFDFAEASEISKSSRIYLLGGTFEGDDLIPDLHKMEKLLLEKGLPQENLKLKIVEGGEHNEAFWSSEFPEAFQWLFPQKNKPE